MVLFFRGQDSSLEVRPNMSNKCKSSYKIPDFACYAMWPSRFHDFGSISLRCIVDRKVSFSTMAIQRFADLRRFVLPWINIARF